MAFEFGAGRCSQQPLDYLLLASWSGQDDATPDRRRARRPARCRPTGDWPLERQAGATAGILEAKPPSTPGQPSTRPDAGNSARRRGREHLLHAGADTRENPGGGRSAFCEGSPLRRPGDDLLCLPRMAFAALVHFGVGFGFFHRTLVMAGMIAAHPMAVFANCHPAVASLPSLRTMHRTRLDNRPAQVKTRLLAAPTIDYTQPHLFTRCSQLESSGINPVPEPIANAPAVHDEEVGACAP